MTIYARIREMGSRFDPDILRQTRELFEPLWPVSSSGGVSAETISYGDDERQVADIYKGPGKDLPIIIFVPGGGFTGGSRAGYRALGEYFARNGYLGMVADYRLAPAWKWPAGAEDVARLVDWVTANAAALGGDDKNIFVFGHSAGATHVSGALFDARFRSSLAEQVRGTILLSGLYEVRQDESRANVLAYFGEDKTQFADRSPLSHAGNGQDSVLVMMSEFDPKPFALSAWALASTLTDRSGKVPKFQLAEGHNHVSSVFALGTEQDAVSSTVFRFIADRSVKSGLVS